MIIFASFRERGILCEVLEKALPVRRYHRSAAHPPQSAPSTHNIQTSNLFDGILFFIIDTHGSIQLTCHHAEQVQATDIGVGNGFEYIRREAFVIGGAINNVLPSWKAWKFAFASDCRKGEANDCVHQKLNAIAQCCGTAHNGCNAVVCDTNLQTVIDFLFGQFLIIEEFFPSALHWILPLPQSAWSAEPQPDPFLSSGISHFSSLPFTFFLASLNQIDKADVKLPFSSSKGNLQGGNGFAEVFTQISQCFSKSAFSSSIWLMKMMRGRCISSQYSHAFSVPTSTPDFAETIISPVSATFIASFTSAAKSK